MNIFVVGPCRPAKELSAIANHNLILLINEKVISEEDRSSVYSEFITYNSEKDLFKEIRAYLNNIDINLLISFTDDNQLLACRISDEFKITNAIDSSLIRTVVSKPATRLALNDAGIPNAKFIVSNSKEKLFDSVRKVGFPCIVKPIDSMASLNVHLANNYDEFANIIESHPSLKAEANVIVEQYLEGEEYSVEALSTENEHHIIGITKKTRNARFVELGHCFPAELDDELESNIKDYVVKVLDAIGFQNSPSHSEVIVTKDGPILVETHSRLGGDKIVDLVKTSTGINLYEVMALQSIGEDISDLIKPQKKGTYAAIAFSVYEDSKSIILTGFRLPEKKPEGILKIEFIKNIGDQLREAKSSYDRIAYCMAEGDTHEIATQLASDHLREIDFF